MLSILAMYNYDPTIFDRLFIPQDEMGRPLFDKETLIQTVLFQNAELSLIYSDPVTLKAMIGLWANSCQYSWEKLGKTLHLEYNPIWNKDGKITETETVESDGTSTNKVSAFNDTNFQNRGQTISDADSSRNYERVEQGNIGVTSTQQLMKEEREVAEFNIYDRISADFRDRFCIQVY